VAAFRHARCNVVTASIDRLDFIHPVFVGNLLILRASVNLTGRTSMEVGVRAETEDLRSGDIQHVASAYLTFVALDEDGHPTQIPALIIGGEEEAKRMRMARARRKARLAEKKREAACDKDPEDCDP
jgi:acyl-CoA hydrolase